MRHELKDFCQARINAFAQRIDAPLLQTEWEQFILGRGQWTWSRLWSIVALEDWLVKNKIILNK
jgi:hypothetical protein